MQENPLNLGLVNSMNENKKEKTMRFSTTPMNFNQRMNKKSRKT